jgi:hypothetical protein
MQRLVPSESLLLTFLALILIMQTYLISIAHNVSAVSPSPSFVRQEIVAAPNDWTLWKKPSDVTAVPTHDGHLIQVENAKDISQCKIGGNFVSPSIQSVSYISDGETLDATVWLNKAFEEPPLRDTIDIYPPTQLEVKVSNLTKTDSHTSIDKYATIKIAHELLVDPSKVHIDGQSNSTIAGNSAYKVVYSAKNSEGVDLKNMTLWTIKNSKLYDITYSAIRANYSYYLPTIQHMINSFQFDNSVSSSSSSSSDSSKKSAIQQAHNNTGDGVGVGGNTTQFKGLGIKINYLTDWKKQEEKTVNNTTGDVIFRSPFQDEVSDIPSWHETIFTMAIAIGSVQHPAVTDYRVILSRSPINNNTINTNNNKNSTWAWTRNVVEVSAYDKQRVLEEEKNYRAFYQQGKPYILFSFDLSKINFPQQYNAVFYITDYFVKQHRFCRLIDITNWVNIPPPEFTMSITPSNSIVLRPGEVKDIELTIKGNTNLPSEAHLTDSNNNSNNNNNNNKTISLSFTPNKVSILPSSVGTSTLHVKALDSAEPISVYTIPIVANISFPNTITNRGGETFSNSKSQILSQKSNVTLSILPPYTPGERFSSFVTTWITPVTGVWTFLAGVGAVIAPLIINIYRKRKTKKSNDSNKSSD